MAANESQRFRIACVLVVAAVCLPNIAEILAKLRPTLTSASLAALGGISLLICAAFAAVCWFTTRPRDLAASGPLVHLLLGVQLIGCFVVNVELVHLVSVQAGAMLPWKPAVRWQAALMTIVLSIAVLAALDGSFEPANGLTHLPRQGQMIATVTNMLAWSLFAFLAGRMIDVERTRRRELAFANAELTATQQLLTQTARESERLRIARDLHDTLGHHLTALAVNLELAAKLGTPEAKPVIERSHLLSRLLLNDVRETVGTMRESASAADVDVGSMLRSMAAAVSQPKVELHLPEPATIAHTPSAMVLVRCVQEGLTNAMRHSQARHVSVQLRRDASHYTLLLRDDGQGSDSCQPGNGLRGMRERVEALGGELHIETAKHKGFALHDRLPNPEPAA